jgi:aspartokinase
MKTNICDITVQKSKDLLNKLKLIYNLVDFEKGDILNTILGNYEVSIIISEKYKEKLLKLIKGEKILAKEPGLTALSINFKGGDFLHTPGVIFTIIRKLAWENINIFEIVSTQTELTLILRQKDSVKAYESLQDLFANN